MIPSQKVFLAISAHYNSATGKDGKNTQKCEEVG